MAGCEDMVLEQAFETAAGGLCQRRGLELQSETAIPRGSYHSKSGWHGP
jgi:hypothetical protein